jgi:hypothetical protein
MKRLVVIAASAFCGISFAQIIPSDPRLIWPARAIMLVSLVWIGSYAVYRSLRSIKSPFRR